MSIAITLHLIAAVIWVGGMFFAHQILRPVAVKELEPPLRLRLWTAVFARFFPWVWLVIVTLLGSGYYIIFALYGGMGNVAIYVHIMNAVGFVMMAIFAYIYFVPFVGLKRAVNAEVWAEGAEHLARIRVLVGTNLLLGLATVAVAAAGRWMY